MYHEWNGGAKSGRFFVVPYPILCLLNNFPISMDKWVMQNNENIKTKISKCCSLR